MSIRIIVIIIRFSLKLQWFFSFFFVVVKIICVVWAMYVDGAKCCKKVVFTMPILRTRIDTVPEK